MREAGEMSYNLTPAQLRNLERLFKAGNALSAALLRLDEQIALFNDDT
jgi:hypothetical protein